MGMEPFDYLAYKKNKMGIDSCNESEDKQAKKRVDIKKDDNKLLYKVCILTFAVFFVAFMQIIGSKSSKIDIEYGRFGDNDGPIYKQQTEETNESEENTAQNEDMEKSSIDNRLFLIKEEEKAPSVGKITEKKEQSEVISKQDFDRIKSNNENLTETKQTTEIEPKAPISSSSLPNKPAIKGKLPVNTAPNAKPLSALNYTAGSSKVLIGKYPTLNDAKQIQSTIGNLAEDMAFVKKINNFYSVQVGSYENFEIAKVQAAKFKAKGFDVWILH